MAAVPEFDPDELADLLDAAVATFDFTLPGQGGGTLGRDLASAAALHISARTRQGLDADGTPFKPNEKKYAAYKLRRYDVDRPGELGGQMASQMSVLGKPVITSDMIIMVYGLDERPRQYALNGTPLKPRETVPTDTDKANWFEDGGRHFYALDSAIAGELARISAEAFERHVKEVLG